MIKNNIGAVAKWTLQCNVPYCMWIISVSLNNPEIDLWKIVMDTNMKIKLW